MKKLFYDFGDIIFLSSVLRLENPVRVAPVRQTKPIPEKFYY